MFSYHFYQGKNENRNQKHQKLNNCGTKKTGFTIIELIVVMAVLAILVAMGLPRLIGYTDDAIETRLKNDARVIQDAIDIHLTQGGEVDDVIIGEVGDEDSLVDLEGNELQDVVLYKYLDLDEKDYEDYDAYEIDFDAISDKVRLSTDPGYFVVLINSPANVAALSPDNSFTQGRVDVSLHSAEPAEPEFPRDKVKMEGKATYTGHSNNVYSVHLGTDGYLYSGSRDNQVHKINPSDMTQADTYTGHSDRVWSVHLGTDGYLYSGSLDGEVHKIK